MNIVILSGRLTADPDIRMGTNDTKIARYILAVERRVKKNTERKSDFIACVCLGKNAEFAEKYLRQGTKIAITGRIQTGSYTNREGRKVYTTDVVVEEQEFGEGKNAERPREQGATPQANMDGFMTIPDGVDEDIPFM